MSEREVFNALFAWLRASARVVNGQLDADRQVTLLCCGWIGGENFEVRQSFGDGISLTIPVHSLLPTMDSTLPSDIDLIHQMQQSLGKGCALMTAAPTRSARIFHCMNARDKGSFVVVQAKSSVSDNSFPEVLQVVDGPEVVVVSDCSVTLSVRTQNRGELRCSLFEVPVHLGLAELQAVVMIPSERVVFAQHLVEAQSKAIRHPKRTSLFRFFGLQPYCCYCALVESTSATGDCDSVVAGIPTLALFKTSDLTSNPSNCFLLSSTPRKLSCSCVFT